MQLSLLTVELTNVKNIYIYIYILNIDKSNLKKQHVHALMLMHAPERQSTCGCGGALTSSRASSYKRWNVRLPQPTTEVFNAGERAMHIMCSMKGIKERNQCMSLVWVVVLELLIAWQCLFSAIHGMCFISVSHQ